MTGDQQRTTERIEEQAGTFEVYANDIELYINLFCEDQGIEDLRKESQSVWNACLMYVQRHVFPDRQALKATENSPEYVNNIMPSTCGAYNYDLLDTICNAYIYYCYMYDKEVSIQGFSKLLGIPKTVIDLWGTDLRLSKKSINIYKKLIAEREESLSAKLASGKSNPVGILSILNHWYSWNLPGVTREQSTRTALTAAELPRLDSQKATEALPDLEKD